VERFVDCQSANAAVEDADGKVSMQVMRRPLVEDLGNDETKPRNSVVEKFVTIVE
jgi:hypothetical protein